MWFVSGELEYVFKGSPSCGVIQYNLRDYMLALCTLYSLGVLVCVATVAAILFVKHTNRYHRQPSSTDVSLRTHTSFASRVSHFSVTFDICDFEAAKLCSFVAWC